jgi:hypothetical protein
MRKIRRMFVGLTPVLSILAIGATSASAINFEWRVNGAKLEAGSAKEFTGIAEGVSDLSGSAGGAAALLLSSKGKLLSGARIIGGIPGTAEGTGVLESVKVDKPANCEVKQAGGSAGVIQTVSLKSEIVEGASAEKGNGEVDILGTPKTGTTYATFEFIGSSCVLKGTSLAVAGSVLGLALPQKSEVVTGLGDTPAATSEYKNQAGAFKKAALTFAGNLATLTGASLGTLVSGEKAGAF